MATQFRNWRYPSSSSFPVLSRLFAWFSLSKAISSPSTVRFSPLVEKTPVDISRSNSIPFLQASLQLLLLSETHFATKARTAAQQELNSV
jgi:hypothetical protein